MNDNYTEDNNLQNNKPELQIRQTVSLRRHLQRLAGAFRLEKANKDLLKNKFSYQTVFVSVYNREFQCEVVFIFWGFVKRDKSHI